MIDHHLFAHFRKRVHMTVSMIGPVHFGTSLNTRSMYAPCLKIRVAADRNEDDAKKRTVRRASPAVCGGAASAEHALEKGENIILQHPIMMRELPVQLIAEAEGMHEAGARHAPAHCFGRKQATFQKTYPEDSL